MDTITITVLPDGTIKMETDKVSMPNHSNAEGFLREMSRLAGGETTRKMKVGADLKGSLHKHTHDGHTHSH